MLEGALPLSKFKHAGLSKVTGSTNHTVPLLKAFLLRKFSQSLDTIKALKVSKKKRMCVNSLFLPLFPLSSLLTGIPSVEEMARIRNTTF